MAPFLRVEGIAAPLPINNVDTDAMIPSRETQSVSRSGYGERLFAYWRYETGTRVPRPDFVLNRPPFDRAVIILAGANYGCGSSREAAVWSHVQFGIRCVIAESYGAIFYNNCIRNGLLPVVLDAESVAEMIDVVTASNGAAMVAVDLEAETVATEGRTYGFSMKAHDRAMLLSGADEIALTLKHRDEIDAFRANDRIDRPWIYDRPR